MDTIPIENFNFASLCHCTSSKVDEKSCHSVGARSDVFPQYFQHCFFPPSSTVSSQSSVEMMFEKKDPTISHNNEVCRAWCSTVIDERARAKSVANYSFVFHLWPMNRVLKKQLPAAHYCLQANYGSTSEPRFDIIIEQNTSQLCVIVFVPQLVTIPIITIPFLLYHYIPWNNTILKARVS